MSGARRSQTVADMGPEKNFCLAFEIGSRAAREEAAPETCPFGPPTCDGIKNPFWEPDARRAGWLAGSFFGRELKRLGYSSVPVMMGASMVALAGWLTVQDIIAPVDKA